MLRPKAMPHCSPPLAARRMRGVMLLEVLVALLIFALGVLGLVALQSKAIKQSTQAKYRADATFLANELLSQMQLGNRASANLQAQYSSDPAGASYTAWSARVAAALPGATTFPPVVIVAAINPLDAVVGAASAPADAALTPSSRVSITLRWKHPSEPAAEAPNQLVLLSEVK